MLFFLVGLDVFLCPILRSHEIRDPDHMSRVAKVSEIGYAETVFLIKKHSFFYDEIFRFGTFCVAPNVAG